MTIKAAVWIHGNAVAVEYPGRLEQMPEGELGSKKGWGTAFWGQPHSSNWFHFPVATPVILDTRSPPLERIFVFYKTRGASVTNVRVHDGPQQVKAFDNLNLEGDHSTRIDSSNSWGINPPITLRYGLGISVGVSFSGFIDEPNPNIHFEILFTTAGADFRSA